MFSPAISHEVGIHDQKYSMIDFDTAPYETVSENAPFPYNALKYVGGQVPAGISEKALALGTQERVLAPQPAILNSAVRPIGMYTVVSSGTDDDFERADAALGTEIVGNRRIFGISDRPAPILYQTPGSIAKVDRPEEYNINDKKKIEKESTIPFSLKELSKESCEQNQTAVAVSSELKTNTRPHIVNTLPIVDIKTGKLITPGNSLRNELSQQLSEEYKTQLQTDSSYQVMGETNSKKNREMIKTELTRTGTHNGTYNGNKEDETNKTMKKNIFIIMTAVILMVGLFTVMYCSNGHKIQNKK